MRQQGTISAGRLLERLLRLRVPERRLRIRKEAPVSSGGFASDSACKTERRAISIAHKSSYRVQSTGRRRECCLPHPVEQGRGHWLSGRRQNASPAAGLYLPAGKLGLTIALVTRLLRCADNVMCSETRRMRNLLRLS